MLGTFKSSGFFSKKETGSKTAIEGLIYSVKPDKKGNYEATQFGTKQKLPEEIKNIKDMDEKICHISGSWLKLVCFDDKEYWNVLTD